MRDIPPPCETTAPQPDVRDRLMIHGYHTWHTHIAWLGGEGLTNMHASTLACMIARMHACLHACMHARMMHARTQACIHSCILACMHACMRACTRARTHARMHARMHACIYEWAHRHYGDSGWVERHGVSKATMQQLQKHMRKYLPWTPAQAPPFSSTCPHACMNACMHTCIHARMHTCMHACMHACMLT